MYLLIHKTKYLRNVYMGIGVCTSTRALNLARRSFVFDNNNGARKNLHVECLFYSFTLTCDSIKYVLNIMFNFIVLSISGWAFKEVDLVVD